MNADLQGCEVRRGRGGTWDDVTDRNEADETIPAIDECGACGALLAEAPPYCPADGNDGPCRNFAAERAARQNA